MTQLWCNSNSTCRATYWIYIPSFKLISQSMLKKSPENADGRTDRWTDRQTGGHCHGIIRPFFKRAYKKTVANWGASHPHLAEKKTNSCMVLSMDSSIRLCKSWILYLYGKCLLILSISLPFRHHGVAHVGWKTYSISQEICTRFCCALLCCGYAIVHNEFTWSIYPYSSGLLFWHWGNR